MDKQNVLSLLKGTNKEKPISLTKLSALVHIDSRVVKEIVRQLRLEGFPVGGSTYIGYHYAHTISDLDGIIASIKASMITRQKTIKALEMTRLRMTKDSQMESLLDEVKQ